MIRHCFAQGRACGDPAPIIADGGIEARCGVMDAGQVVWRHGDLTVPGFLPLHISQFWEHAAERFGGPILCQPFVAAYHLTHGPKNDPPERIPAAGEHNLVGIPKALPFR